MGNGKGKGELANKGNSKVNGKQGKAEEIIPGWTDELILTYFERGFKPRQKTVRGKEYLTLRAGNHEKSLGTLTGETWEHLNELYGKFIEPASEGQSGEETGAGKTQDIEDLAKKNLEYLQGLPPGSTRSPARKASSILSTKLKRLEVVPTTFTPSLDTLYYYELFKKHGYEGSFEDFMNETIKAYFLIKGISPGLIITVKEGEEI